MNFPRRYFSLLLVTLVLSGCLTDPPADLIQDFVASENRRSGTTAVSESDTAKKKSITRTARAKEILGKEFRVYIHSTYRDDGIASVNNLDVRVPGAEVGDIVKIRITEITRSKIVQAEMIGEPIGTAQVSPIGGEIEEGQVYSFEIIGRSPSGDYFGLIGGLRAFVLGARSIGEKVKAKVLAIDTLEGGEKVVYLKKTFK